MHCRPLKFLALSIAASCYFCALARSEPLGLSVMWSASQPGSLLKAFSTDEFKQVKKVSSTEVDPATGKQTRFSGFLLSDVIDRALAGMSNDRKALIDLVILKNGQGTLALIPRSFVVKYPVLLASSEDRKALPGLRSVVPWTSKSKTRAEGLPLETYFLGGVNEIELGNYRERYGAVFLRSRTEPLAMRGEKIFVQSCLSCHDSASGMSKAQQWTGQHPATPGALKMDGREQRALRSYLDLRKLENPASANAAR